MALAGFFAVVLSALPLTAVTEDRGVLVESAFLVAALLGLGALLRAVRLPDVGVTLSQIVVWLAYGALNLARLTPGLPWSDKLATVFSASLHHVSSQVAPMAANDSVRFFLVLIVGLIALLYDLCGITCRAPGATLLPLVALYFVPALALTTNVSVWMFLPVAAAWLLVMIAAEVGRPREWTTGVAVDSAPPRASGRIGLPVTAAVGALALTLAAGLVIPPLMPRPLTGGTGSSLVLRDPSLDLRRNLTEQSSEVVLRYTTTAPAGTYLRMATLALFSSEGWKPASQAVRYGAVPDVPGYDAEPEAKRYRSHIEVGQFDSQWLPVPYAPRSLTTSTGRWGFAVESLDVVTDEAVTAGIAYDVDWLDVHPTAARLADAVVGTPREGAEVTSLPGDLPPEIRTLAERLTRDASTPSERATTLQAYLRSSTFTYSTKPQAGSGYEALTRFLFTDHTGYCEQFAAAFAVLGRAVGLPTRVVVGFTAGTLVDGAYEVTGRQMHAWPEVYFRDLGWVGYEPTPGVATPPDYTLPRSTTSAAPTESAPTQSTTQTSAPTRATTAAAPSTSPATEGTRGATGGWLVGAGIALAVVVLAGVVSIPGVLRARRRAARLDVAASGPAQERAEAAWSEIRDTFVDLGRPWPEGSPRVMGAWLAGSLPQAAADLRFVADAVEQARYAQRPIVPDDLDGRTRRIIDQARTWSTRSQRVRAQVLPRSMWRRHD